MKITIRSMAMSDREFTCHNCGENVSKYVTAMHDAGFEPRHLMCPECGQVLCGGWRSVRQLHEVRG